MKKTNSLFNPKVIQRAIPAYLNEIPQEHKTIINDWANSIKSGAIKSFGEKEFDIPFINQILINLLGYSEYKHNQEYTLRHERQLGRGPVDIALGYFKENEGQVLAPFELKGAKTRDLEAIIPGRQESPVEQAWGYALNNKGTEWVLVTNYMEIRLYAYSHGNKYYEVFNLENISQTEEYAKFILLLSADNLLSGKTKALLEDSDKADEEITDKLYKEYKKLRGELITKISKSNPSTPILDVIGYVQLLLDRVLFIAFAEDTKLLPNETLRTTIDEGRNSLVGGALWDYFKALFDAIDKGKEPRNIPAYNGGLFKKNPALNSLHISDEICEKLGALGDYDYESEISVNILGHIFEQSISDIEEIKAKALGEDQFKKSKRKKEGVYYTPNFVTRYIVEQAIGGWLEDRKKEIGFESLPILTVKDYESIRQSKKGKKKGTIQGNSKIEEHYKAWEKYKEVLTKVRVLDPACGSGAFLIEAFDYLVSEGKKVNLALAELRGGQDILFRWDKYILRNNLYGVDINPESVEITKLSLWLKTANPKEPLTYLEDNIKCGNSLVDDPKNGGKVAFDWVKGFPGIMASGGFDVIVGNPPYVLSRDNTLDVLKEYVAKNFRLIKDKINLYLLFIERGYSLLKDRGYFSLIVPNSFLGVESASLMREHLVQKTNIKSVVNLLGSTFEGVNVEAAIFCVSKEFKRNNIVECKNSYQPSDLQSQYVRIPQENWKENRGSLFDLKSSEKDFSLIKKLESCPVVEDCYEVRAGLQAYEKGKGTPEQTVADVKNHVFDYSFKFDQSTYPYLGGKDVFRYGIKWSGQWLRYGEWLSQPRQFRIFSNPRILIREITGRYPRVLESVYTEEVYLNNKSIINILSRNADCSLKFLLGILNSKVISFYHSRRAVKGNRNLFPKAVIGDVKKYPFPLKSVNDQETLVGEVEKILVVVKECNEVKDNFLSLLEAEFEAVILSRKLADWPELEFNEFIKELQRNVSPKKIPLDQKSEWMAYFEKEKEHYAILKHQCRQIDLKIDQIVYNLYGLNEEDIQLIENG